mmetsp:Transcript_119663/g.338772  ORF Transcript_119663/g.338772 Transcript_119663/m.338772 type:complete len:258 (+) Transcript_119663:432-1205(+)
MQTAHRLTVQSAVGLVEQGHNGKPHHLLRDCDTFLLPTGQKGDSLRLHGTQAKLWGNRLYALLDVGGAERCVADSEREAKQLRYCKVLGERLKLMAIPDNLVVRSNRNAGCRVAADEECPGSPGTTAQSSIAQHVQESGLASTRGADDAHHLPRTKLALEILQQGCALRSGNTQAGPGEDRRQFDRDRRMGLRTIAEVPRIFPLTFLRATRQAGDELQGSADRHEQREEHRESKDLPNQGILVGQTLRQGRFLQGQN